MSQTSGERSIPSEQHTSVLRAILKTGFLLLSLTCLILAVRLFELNDVLNPAWADLHLRAEDGAVRMGGIVLYVLLVAMLSPVGVPRQALSAVGGYAFGALYGTLWAGIGLIAGCAAGFFYARFLARSLVQRRFGRSVRWLDAFLSNNPFAMTVAIRFLPVGNNALTNLTAGVSNIPPLPFLLGSALGYLPQTVIFSLLGSGVRVAAPWRMFAATILFAVSSCIGLLLYRRFKASEVAAQARPNAHEPSSEGDRRRGTLS